jgi:hypothetical protein
MTELATIPAAYCGEVSAVTLPDGLPEHWDLADKIPDVIKMDVRALLDSAPEPEVKQEPEPGESPDTSTKLNSSTRHMRSCSLATRPQF